MKAKRTSIADDTPILPSIVAESVVQEVALALEDERSNLGEKAVAFLDGADEQRALAERLSNRADATYAANDDFAAKMKGKGDGGRDTLYAFMRHWAAADVLNTLGRKAYDALPEGFAVGQEPPARGGPAPR